MTGQLREWWRATPAPATDADRCAIESCVRDYFNVNALWRWADGHGPRV